MAGNETTITKKFCIETTPAAPVEEDEYVGNKKNKWKRSWEDELEGAAEGVGWVSEESEVGKNFHTNNS